jgi:hypothetical protein
VQLFGERFVVGRLKAAPAVRRQAVAVPDLHDQDVAMPTALAIARTVQCVAS